MGDRIRFFKDLNSGDVAEVGGKNASLGEMIAQLGPKGIRIPLGFATTAEAYWEFLEYNGLKEKLNETLQKLDRKEYSNLKQIGKKLREYVLNGEFPDDLANEIKDAYRKL